MNGVPDRFARHRCPACYLDVKRTNQGNINLHFINGADGVERCGGSDQPFRIAQPYMLSQHQPPRKIPLRPRPQRITLARLRDSA